MAANMEATYDDVSGAIVDSDPDLFSALCGLTDFVANSHSVLTIFWKMTPTEVAVLCLLLRSGASPSHLALYEELPHGTAVQLGSAIRYSSASTSNTIQTLSLGHGCEYVRKLAPELLRMFAASANPALEYLSIDTLKFNGNCLYNPIIGFTGLRSLTISEYGCYSCSVPVLTAGVGMLRKLVPHRILGIALADWDVEAMAVSLKPLPMLTELCINMANIKTEAGEQIGGLVALGRIRKLDLGSDFMADEGVSAMVDAILVSPRGCKLQELNLQENWITPIGGTKVSELVSRSPHLQALNLTGNHAGDTVATVFRQGVHSLREFSVCDCGLSHQGVESMLGALSYASPALSVFRMGENGEGDLGTRAVSQYIISSGWSTLLELGMQDSGITEAGALELSSAFVKAYALRSLNMSSNCIGPRGVAAIMDALVVASVKPMNTLDFQYCDIRDNGVSMIGRLIRCRGCRNLYLCSNKINDTGAKVLADSVVATPCIIERLNLAANPIGDEEVAYILDKLVQQPRRLIDELDMSLIGIGVEGAMAVKRAVEARGVLDRLRVDRHVENQNADKILKGVEMWERNSKFAGNAILEFADACAYDDMSM